MSEERRRSVRANARLTTIIKNLSTHKVWRALTKNVSGVGICVVADEFLEVGSQLEVEIKLPDQGAPITFTGEVVWSQMVGGARKSYEALSMEAGIRFVEIPPKDQRLLQQYVMMNPPPPENS